MGVGLEAAVFVIIIWIVKHAIRSSPFCFCDAAFDIHDGDELKVLL